MRPSVQQLRYGGVSVMHSVQPPAMQVSPQAVGLPRYQFNSPVKSGQPDVEHVCQMHDFCVKLRISKAEVCPRCGVTFTSKSDATGQAPAAFIRR
ncbi:hypothetical protein GPY23_19350 [Photorhabdus bodei]|nr:hypothetical protein [Photorhabdus bodei]